MKTKRVSEVKVSLLEDDLKANQKLPELTCGRRSLEVVLRKFFCIPAAQPMSTQGPVGLPLGVWAMRPFRHRKDAECIKGQPLGSIFK